MHSAPAKIILFGEHAVVYGQPAIAVPFDTLSATAQAIPAAAGSGLSITAPDVDKIFSVNPHISDDNALVYAAQLTLRKLDKPVPDVTLEVHASIPIASGLGSGAAISAALIRELSAYLGEPLDGQPLNDLVYEVEKLHHGTPSGIDNTVIVYNAPIYFVRNQSPTSFMVGKPLTFLVADTGVGASTKESVGAVRKLVESQSNIYRPYIEQIGQIVEEARTHIEKGYLLGIGHLMDLNHNVLSALTVSAPVLDKLVSAARQAGALGAKLSGGGRGGNMIALIDPTDEVTVTKALQEAGAAHVWPLHLKATVTANN